MGRRGNDCDVEFVGVDAIDCGDRRTLKQTVMLVSNEDEPVVIGHITGFFKMPSGQYIPNVELETGRSVLTFSVILPYHEGLRKLLDGLPYKKRHELLRRVFQLQKEIDTLFYKWDDSMRL